LASAAASPSGSPLAAAFDALASRYDALFSDHPSGRIVRQAVWRVADEVFAGADRVLDLGCGTGVDAVHLAARGIDVVALDVAPQMVAVARDVAAAAAAVSASGVGSVAVHVADVGDPSTWPVGVSRPDPPENRRPPDRAPDRAPYAGALADFGVLNCIGDLAPLGAALAALVRPGGCFVAVVMPPGCAWETVLGLARGDVRRATRRWRGRASADLGTGRWPVWYRPPRAVVRGLGPAWQIIRVVPIGVVVPPSWAVARGGAFDRPWLWRAWTTAETAARRLPAAARWADHVAVVLRRAP
jgi:SAM-dependent methyltransferase